MLFAHATGGVLLQIGTGHRRTAGLTLPVGALAQSLQRPVDTVEDGRSTGQLGFVALFHNEQGSARVAPRAVGL